MLYNISHTLINLLFHGALSLVLNLNLDKPLLRHLLSCADLHLVLSPRNLLQLSWNTTTRWLWTDTCKAHNHYLAWRLTHRLSNCCTEQLQPAFQSATGRAEPLLDNRNNPCQLMPPLVLHHNRSWSDWNYFTAVPRWLMNSKIASDNKRCVCRLQCFRWCHYVTRFQFVRRSMTNYQKYFLSRR